MENILKRMLFKIQIFQTFRTNLNAFKNDQFFSGELWEKICRRTFPKEPRQEMEAYRELYERCTQEREAKLDKLTARVQNSYKDIKSNQSQTRLTYVDTVAKPPRGVKRAQEKNGTGLPIGSSHDLAKAKRARTSSFATPGSGRESKKTKVAPMMAKTLKLARGLKSGFRR
jgi:transcription elongation factor B polypeptide 3